MPDGSHRASLHENFFSDETVEWGSERPDDPSLTDRVMTVMLPSDW